MSSKSKRKHANKGYNRANTGLAASEIEKKRAAEIEQAETISADAAAVDASGAPAVMTAKDFRRREIEKQKQEKLEKKLAKKAEKNDPKRKEKKDKEKKEKRNIFAEMGSELKKVHWPTWSEAMKATGVVFGVTVVFGLVVLGLDRLFGFLYELLIKGGK